MDTKLMASSLPLPKHHIPLERARKCMVLRVAALIPVSVFLLANSLTFNSCHFFRLKWKPSEENTVDFKVTEQGSGSYHIGILLNEGSYRDYGEITLEDDTSREWSRMEMNGRIIECRWDPEWPNSWRFSRFRDDKLDANHISVYEKILESIHDNVTKEQVCCSYSHFDSFLLIIFLV